MKEFSVTFRDGLTKGIKPWKRNPRGQEALTTCHNLEPSKGGLIPYEHITNPMSGVTIDWPFPQLFLGQDVRVLATATKIYELATWTLGAAKLTVTENERWDFIDFGSYLILTNGTKLCIRDYAGAWTSNDYTTYIPRFSTGCNFNGQVVAGNVKSTWHGCGTGSLIWSKIGSIDFTPDGTNEAGFRNIPWEGDVLRVKKLGNGVVVYCENGIGVLSPFQQTFGWDGISDMGLDWKGAVDGNENVHIFVGKDRHVYKITKDFSVERLGYYDQFKDDAVNQIVVQHNPADRKFHICGDGAGFVLTEQGLASCWQRRVSTVACDNGVSYGVYTDTEDYSAYIITDVLDFGLRGIKTIHTVELGGQWAEDESATVTVYYRNDGSTTFNGVGATAVANPNGVSTPVTSGVEFLIGVLFSSLTDVELDYMNIRVKLSDKRYVRGAYNVA